MLNLRRRLRRLERSPFFQPPAESLIDAAIARALEELSTEDLQLLIVLGRDRNNGVRRMVTPEESAALAAQRAAFQRHGCLTETEIDKEE